MGEMSLKIKDASMIERIAHLAKEHNRTPNMEALELLAEALNNAERFDRYKEALRISAMTPKGVKQSDSTIFIREERNRGH
jgi:hypothetical protein